MIAMASCQSMGKPPSERCAGVKEWKHAAHVERQSAEWIVLADTAAGATSSSVTQQLKYGVIAMARFERPTAQTYRAVGQALSKLAG